MKKIIALATLAVVTLSLQAKNLSAERLWPKEKPPDTSQHCCNRVKMPLPTLSLRLKMPMDGNCSGTVRLPTVGVARV